MTPTQRVDDLRARNPEWAPWLAVVSAMLKAIGGNAWDAAVPDLPKMRNAAVPLLAQAVLRVDARAIAHAFLQLVRSAHANGTSPLSRLGESAIGAMDAAALFQIAINRDRERLHAFASNAGVDPAAFEALALLLPMPFLHACNRRWGASASAAWSSRYCPVCGAWPAFAEVLGIERSRHLRCGQCGCDWETHGLTCVYCGMSDHHELVSLVPEDVGSPSSVDACKRCRGYLKVFTRLRGSAPSEVIVEDLATAELDIVAAERGYQRPQGTAFTLHVTLDARDA